MSIALQEYEIERNKKESFNNRAGLIITVSLAIILAIYEKIPLSDIFILSSKPLTFIMLIWILSVIGIYTLLASTFYFSIKIIFIKEIPNFDISILTMKFVSSAKIDTVAKLLEVYINLVKVHRAKNSTTAKQLAKSQKCMLSAIILVIVNLNLL